jgi:pilus assembly protein CpaE
LETSNNGHGGGLRVMTVCGSPETVERVKTATVREHGTFVGALPSYSLQEGELQVLLKLQSAEVGVCIIDFDADREQAVQTANSIHSRGRTVLMALSEQSDPKLIVEAMRAGCSEYLAKPITVESVSESLKRLCGKMQEARDMGTSGKILAFLGCRGGAGTTTLAVHVASYIAKLHSKKTLVVDQHQHLGHVALYLGQDHAFYDFFELVRNVNRLDQTLLNGFVAHHESGLDILPGPSSLNGHIDVSFEAVERSIRFLAEVYEYVAIDCAPGLSDLNLITIDTCDRLYLVATPDVPALRDLARHIDRLLQCNVSPSKMQVVINRYDSSAAVSLEQIEKAIGQPVRIAVPNNYAELMRAMNSGTPVPPERRTDFSSQIRKWVSSLVPTTASNNGDEPKRKFALWR